MDEYLQECMHMLKTNDSHLRSSAETVLLNICQNILNHPSHTEYRKVVLSDPIVLDALLPAAGAMECLMAVGFVEGTDCFFLPRNAPLTKVKSLMDMLQEHINGTKPKARSVDDDQALFTSEAKKEKNFFSKILRHNQLVMRFEEPALQEKARSVVPLIDLEIATMARIRMIQKRIKLSQDGIESDGKKQCRDTDINPRDVFLVELMHWFKYKFFTWVDSPTCPECKAECSYESTRTMTDPRCPHVEYHRCNQCNVLVQFPRYTEPEPLLKLRRGRCGEWAIVFTLLCRSLGYDGRLIWDQTDHAWTEVWSATENKWIHLDPCENVIDRPLMYERGWRKKLTYVTAFSKDEVQDVTWRYTRDYAAVMSRRNLCSEEKLLKFFQWMNARQQTISNSSSLYKREVIRRRAIELAGFLYIPNQQNQEDGGSYEGRSSGSHAWRTARGEISEDSFSGSYTWDISKYGKSFELSYCIVTDVYVAKSEDGSDFEKRAGWQEGVNAVEGSVFRKVEDDWKVAYLARSPDNDSGTVKWCFEVKDPKLRVNSFQLQAKDKVFHSGSTSWKLEGFFENGKQCKTLPIDDCTNYCTQDLKGSCRLVLTAIVSGGTGDVAWQHAQLFRQSLQDKGDSMLVSITLTDAEVIA